MVSNSLTRADPIKFSVLSFQLRVSEKSNPKHPGRKPLPGAPDKDFSLKFSVASFREEQPQDPGKEPLPGAPDKVFSLKFSVASFREEQPQDPGRKPLPGAPATQELKNHDKNDPSTRCIGWKHERR